MIYQRWFCSSAVMSKCQCTQAYMTTEVVVICSPNRPDPIRLDWICIWSDRVGALCTKSKSDMTWKLERPLSVWTLQCNVLESVKSVCAARSQSMGDYHRLTLCYFKLMPNDATGCRTDSTKISNRAKISPVVPDWQQLAIYIGSCLVVSMYGCLNSRAWHTRNVVDIFHTVHIGRRCRIHGVQWRHYFYYTVSQGKN